MFNFLLDISRWPGETAIPALLERLSAPDALGLQGVRGTVLVSPEDRELGQAQLPAQWRLETATRPIEAASEVLQQASSVGRPLLVLLEPLILGSEVVGTLLEALKDDPMCGAAIPRLRTEDGSIRSLKMDTGRIDDSSLPPRILAEIPKRYILPEWVGACMLLRRELVLSLDTLDPSFQTLHGAWLHYLCRARRLGFRCIVVNRAVAAVGASCAAETEEHAHAEEADYWALHRTYPDAALARKELLEHSACHHEKLLACAIAKSPIRRRHLLIDARGLQGTFNGTTACILGTLSGIGDFDCGWRITVLVGAGPAQHHCLQARFPTWEFLHEVVPRSFTAAYRLSQPWDIQTMIELHRMALFNFYLMLDTISWDVLYVGTDTPTLRGTWDLLAEHTDGLLYISEFTAEHFRQRFEVAPTVREYTSWLSFDPDDYAKRVPGIEQEEPPYLFVVGNQLDHKFVLQTVDLLSHAFPFCRIKALGAENRQSGNVITLASGAIPAEDVERLYAEARVVVFPSFFEGFGFPMLQGLSYGRPVVVRRSSLVRTIAAKYAGPGQLFTYESLAELVELVGGLLHDAAPRPVALGTEVETRPRNWRNIAAGMIGFIEESCAAPNRKHWLRREKNVKQLLAYRSQG